MAELKPGGKLLIGVFAAAFLCMGLYNMSPGFKNFVDTNLFPTRKGPGTIDPNQLAAIRDGTAPVGAMPMPPATATCCGARST